ncbi:xylulokinase [Paradevosia shaoguanensis]|uniref:xylulokinase n=1 Tax=Paradevosia shaoguanensis TaxID=1335043 RepID=UPI003C71E3CF
MTSPTDPILVFDIGSSGLKAALFAADGTMLDSDEVAYPPGSHPHRQSPEGWWEAAVEAVGHLPPLRVSAIVLSGTMENLIAVDGDGNALGEALLYSDPCGAAYVEAYRDRIDPRIAGNAPEPLMTAFKLAWLREHEPEHYAAAARFLPGSKDFVAYRLTGKYVTDPTCAATTGLMDLAARDWSDDLLTLFEIERARLPVILPAATVIGTLSEEAAELLHLDPGIPVINGCGDGGATTVGSGADRTDDISLYLGTTGWVARIVPPAQSAAPRPFYRLPHPFTDDIIEIAPILSAGAAADWARTAVGSDIPKGEALAEAADRQPGNALFLPYLHGERSPFIDLDVRAAFLNVSGTDGPGELYYAALEGVAFAISANIAAMGELGSGSVSLVGGGALSAVWPQIIADVLRAPITRPASPVNATSFGAFRIALRALGHDDAETSFSVVATPRPDRYERLDRQRQLFDAGTAFARTLGR